MTDPIAAKDPIFVGELGQKIRSGDSPVPPPPKQLVRRAVPMYFKKGVRRSVILHTSLLLIVLSQGLLERMMYSPEELRKRFERSQMRSAIRVDLVDLPSLKLEDLAKVDPTEAVGVPPKIQPKELIEEKAKPSSTAMLDRTKPAEKTGKDEKKKSAADRLKELRNNLRSDARRKELMAKLKGEVTGEGRAPLAGNVLSQGDSLTGEVATLNEMYTGKLKAHIRKNFSMPAWMTTGRLNALVVVRIAPDGRILSKEFDRKSGNAEFDDYVMKALSASDPFPAPPPELKRLYMEEGLGWAFPQ